MKIKDKAAEPLKFSCLVLFQEILKVPRGDRSVHRVKTKGMRKAPGQKTRSLFLQRF